MVDTPGYRQYTAGLEWMSDLASEDRSNILQPDHVALYMAADDTTTLGVCGGRLVDKLVEIGSTVAIAGSIALELATASEAKW